MVFLRVFIRNVMWVALVSSVPIAMAQQEVDITPLDEDNSSLTGESVEIERIPAESIDEITGTVRLLGDEPFRPKGKMLTLTLDEAIQIAMEQNPNVRISKSQVRQGFANLDLVNSSYNTTVDISARAQERLRRLTGGSGFRIDPDQGLIQETTTQRENGELFTFGPVLSRTFRNGSTLEIAPTIEYEHRSDASFDAGQNGDGQNEEDRYNIGASFNIPLNSRPREQINTDIENARLGLVSDDYSLTIQKSQIEQQVINLYWNLKQLEEQIDIQNERILQARRVEFIIQTQFEFENASEVQVGQAQIDVLNNEADMINLEGQLRNAQEQFNIVLGTPVETQLDLSEELRVKPLPISASEYVEMVSRTNLTLKNLRLSIQQSENNLRVARLGQQPSLSLNTSYSRTDEGVEDILGAFVFNWPMFDGGATRARVRALEEQIEQQRINLWNQERSLVQDTYSDLRELQLQQQRVNILRQNVDQAYVNLQNDLFIFTETGRISFRDMQDSQIELAQSRLSLTGAIVTYNLARSSLLQKVHDYDASEGVEPVLGLLDEGY